MNGSTNGATFYFFDEIIRKGFEQGGSIRSMRKKTVRWTVVTTSDQASADARVESLALRQIKHHCLYGSISKGIIVF